jgi:uncharacterized RDD family membrane protein YckC
MNTRNLEGQYAGFLTRAGGVIVDFVILAVSVVVLYFATTLLFKAVGVDLGSCPTQVYRSSLATALCAGGRWFLVASVMLLNPIYYILFWTLVGQSIGQRVMGVRVVRLDGHNIGFVTSVVRWVGCQICMATFGIGYLWVLVDDRRMGWHDKMARTCVLYSWKAVEKERFIDRMARRLKIRKASGEATQAPPAETAGAAGS